MHIAISAIKAPQRSPTLCRKAKGPHGAMRNTPTVLIIGGDVRHSHLDKLRSALSGFQVDWIPTREADPGPSRFASRIRRQEVSLVVVLYGLIRHQHAKDITRLCRYHGQPILRLHRSPNVEAITSILSRIATSNGMNEVNVQRREILAV